MIKMTETVLFVINLAPGNAQGFGVVVAKALLNVL